MPAEAGAPAATQDDAAAADAEADAAEADSGFIERLVTSLTTPVEDQFQKAETLYHKPPAERDLEAAFRAYLKAAKRGHPGAQNRLGWMYERGEGVELDYGQAAEWHRRAAEQGHLNGMNDVPPGRQAQLQLRRVQHRTDVREGPRRPAGSGRGRELVPQSRGAPPRMGGKTPGRPRHRAVRARRALTLKVNCPR
jgi:TPR repeat protein